MAERIKARLLERSKAEPGEDVTFRLTRWNQGSIEQIALVDIQAGDHHERNSWMPLRVQAEDLKEFLKTCKKVSNFYVLKQYILHPKE